MLELTWEGWWTVANPSEKLRGDGWEANVCIHIHGQAQMQIPKDRNKHRVSQGKQNFWKSGVPGAWVPAMAKNTLRLKAPGKL